MRDLSSIIQFVCDGDKATTGQSITAPRITSIDLLTAALDAELTDAGYSVDAAGEIVGTTGAWYPLVANPGQVKL